MELETLRRKLDSAVTQFDIKQSTKRGYNHYALAQYLAAVSETIAEVESGKDVRKALAHNFNDRLLDVCLAAIS